MFEAMVPVHVSGSGVIGMVYFDITVAVAGLLHMQPLLVNPSVIEKRSGDPNPQYFSKSTAVQMGRVLPYKWEAYCSTNGRRIM